MPGVNVTVSLSEVLEVRGAPLTETEIWTLLCLGAEALQDIFITGNGIILDQNTCIMGRYRIQPKLERN